VQAEQGLHPPSMAAIGQHPGGFRGDFLGAAETTAATRAFEALGKGSQTAGQHRAPGCVGMGRRLCISDPAGRRQRPGLRGALPRQGHSISTRKKATSGSPQGPTASATTPGSGPHSSRTVQPSGRQHSPATRVRRLISAPPQKLRVGMEDGGANQIKDPAGA